MPNTASLSAVRAAEEQLRQAYGDPIPCGRTLPPECRVVWGWLVTPVRGGYWRQVMLIDGVWHTREWHGESAFPVLEGEVVTHWHAFGWPPTPAVDKYQSTDSIDHVRLEKLVRRFAECLNEAGIPVEQALENLRSLPLAMQQKRAEPE